MLKSKKGIELSINFIVMLIITLAVFGMGLVLANKFFGQAKDIQRDLDTKTEQEILNILDTGERVSIPINQKTINRGKSEVFGLGILNVIGEKSSFSAEIKAGIYIPEGSTSSQPWPTPNPLYREDFSRDIANNERVVFSIPVSIPKGTPNGRYVIDVTVTCNDPDQSCSNYGKQKIYVTVK